MTNLKKMVWVLLAFVLTACGPGYDEAFYDASIEAGLDAFAMASYAEAEAQFQQALEEKEDDEAAEAYLTQTKRYQVALHFFEDDQFEEGFVKAEEVMDTPNGAASISEKAADLISEQKERRQQIAQEELEAEEREAAEKLATEQAELERKEAEAAAAAEAEAEAEANAGYDFSDFMGYYLHFISSEWPQSDMFVGIARDQIILGFWGSDGNVYEILDTSIKDNVLFVDYFLLDAYAPDGGIYGSMEITLDESSGEKGIRFSFEPDTIFYAASYDEVLSYDYTTADFVYGQ